MILRPLKLREVKIVWKCPEVHMHIFLLYIENIRKERNTLTLYYDEVTLILLLSDFSCAGVEYHYPGKPVT